MIVSNFISSLEHFGSTEAIIADDVAVTYLEIYDKINEYRYALKSCRITSGSVVAVEGSYSYRNCALMLALIAESAIVVPLPAQPESKRLEFMGIGEVEHLVRLGDDNVLVASATGVAATHPLYREIRAQRAPGLVLFSSGTTGKSKASVLNFTKLIANYDTTKLRPRRTLAFLSLDHIGGVNTMMSTLIAGGCLITVRDRGPETIFDAIETYRVDTLPTTPTFITMSLISGNISRYDLSSLKLVTYGTEPMPPQTLKKINSALPDVRLKQTYGLSEVGILPTKSKANDSLWVTLGAAGFSYKIIDNILWIKSDMAMLGYLNAPAPFDSEGYFNTQDVVEIDGEYLKILGRKSEIINIGGEKVYPNEVESVILELDNIAEATVSGKPSQVTGMVVKAVVRPATPEPVAGLRSRIYKHCGARLEPYKVPVIIDVTDQALHSDRLKKIRVAS